LIESIQEEAQDTMKHARDILSEANQSKNEAEILKDEIETSRNALLGERMDIRKQSACLKSKRQGWQRPTIEGSEHCHSNKN
jgi:hypothetical protein